MLNSLNFKVDPLAAKSYHQLGFVVYKCLKTSTIINNTDKYGEMWSFYIKYESRCIKDPANHMN